MDREFVQLVLFFTNKDKKSLIHLVPFMERLIFKEGYRGSFGRSPCW